MNFYLKEREMSTQNSQTTIAQKKKYIFKMLLFSKFKSFKLILNNNHKTHFIEINNKKLIACLKLYSEKQRKFKDCNDPKIIECLNKSIRKLVFFASLVILRELVNLKVGFVFYLFYFVS
jgi:hypothetical protein